jgi:hypothetical protein
MAFGATLTPTLPPHTHGSPTYFFFGPTILSDFFCYSIARYDDISWGTKAVQSKAKPSASGQANRAAEKARRRPALQAADAPAGSAAASGRRRAALTQGLRATEAQESSAHCTTVLSSAQVAVCLALAAINSGLREVSHYLLYFGLAIGGVGYIIMTLSFCYFVPRAVCGARSTCVQRVNALVVFLGWCAIVGALVCVSIPGLGLEIVGAGAFFGTYAILMLLALPHCLGRSESSAKAHH